MRLLTEKKAWLALAEAIYGAERLPHLGRHYMSAIRRLPNGDDYLTRIAQDYYCSGLCDAVHAMRCDCVIDFKTSMRMLGRLERVCDYVGHAYLFGRGQWEPRVDLCLTMHEVLP